jgi:serine/threonine protein kinase
MAPEYTDRNVKLTKSVDIWSFGIIMEMLLYGCVPKLTSPSMMHLLPELK